MRRVAVLALISIVGCFQELPAPPGSSAGEGSSTTGQASTGEVATTSGGEASDGDLTTTATTGAPAPEGLFACELAAPCEPWDCKAGCDAAGPVGACVLTALRDGVSGVIEVERCAGECEVHRLLVRGGGGDQVRWQWRTSSPPASYSEPRTCALAPPEFFSACLTQFEPACADPMMWVAGCQTGAASCL